MTTKIKLPSLHRRILLKVQTRGRSTEGGVIVHKLSKGLCLDEILTKRGWQIERESRDYLHAIPPTNDFGDDPLAIEIDVPTQEQVLALARQVYVNAPDRPWADKWGEWGVVYYPRCEYQTADVDPETGAHGRERRAGWVNAHFDVGVHGLFHVWIHDVGGAERYVEDVEIAAPRPPTLFETQHSAQPDNAATPSRFLEGSPTEVLQTRYERNPTARRACIDHWGKCCGVCGLDFEVVYGELGASYIHVHHLVPLAMIGERYEVDAVNDLRPVCANCHAMLHRQEPPVTIEALRNVMEELAKS